MAGKKVIPKVKKEELSKADMEYIRSHKKDPVADLAKDTGKPRRLIEDYLKDLGGMSGRNRDHIYVMDGRKNQKFGRRDGTSIVCTKAAADGPGGEPVMGD